MNWYDVGRVYHRVIFIGTMLVIAQVSYGDNSAQGYEEIIVDDAEDRQCINAKKDRVSVSIDRLVVFKDARWFTADNAVDIVLDVGIDGRDESYLFYSYSVPIRYRAGIDDYDKGTVSIPISIALMTDYPLSRDGYVVHRFHIEFAFINSSDPTLLSHVFSKLPEATKGIQALGSPYVAAAGQLSEILGNVVDAIISDAESKGTANIDGNMDLVFFKTECQRKAAYSGTYLYLRSYNSSEEGAVAFQDLHRYCYLKYPDADAIYITRRKADGDCTYSYDQRIRLLNPHFTITVSITSDVEPGRVTIESGLADYLDDK